MIPFPFICGCGRSGTTLLRAMFDAHPELAVPGEAPFLARMLRKRARYESPLGVSMERLVGDLAENRRFKIWQLPMELFLDTTENQPPADLPEAFRALYREYARAHGKPRYGDKTPFNVSCIALIAEAFSESRFIHIIRDGRDVALSYRDAPWGPRTAAQAAYVWKRRVRAGRQAGRELGADRYREVRYEALLEDAESVLRELCYFIELDFSQEMLAYHRGAESIVSTTANPGLHKRLHLPPTKGLRDWRTDMSAREVDVFESVAGDLLAELGYVRGSRAGGLKRPVVRAAVVTGEYARRRLHRLLKRVRTFRRRLITTASLRASSEA